MSSKTVKIAMIGMLSAIAFLSVLFIRIPVVLFLSYEPKDVFITIGGLIWGPMAAFAVACISSFIEFISISQTGPIGLLFNIVASVIFACTPAIIYRKHKTLKSAVYGLILGSVITVVSMLLWNYAITPFYMGVPREEVVKLLVPAILPFNLIKVGLNTGFSLLLYKPIINKLKHISSLNLKSTHPAEAKTNVNISVLLGSLLLIGVCVALIIYFQS